MSGTVGDRLSAARRRAFVGREAEMAQFRALVTDPQPDVAALMVHGPAGIGKSTLLRRWLETCAELGVPAVLLDARDIPATPDGFAAAVAASFDPTAGSATGRRVLMLDTYELLLGLEVWLREAFLPTLPADTLVVLGGQYPPAPAWRTDPGWAQLVRPLLLTPFTAQESRAYLAARAVDGPATDPAIAFTRGHPLALALVSEVIRTQGRFDPRDSPDVIATLVDQLCAVAPTREHRLALEASAQVRAVTEPLLAAMMAVPDATELFTWLRGLPVTQVGRTGIFLHDLARDVLEADVRWRRPDRFVRFHDQARAYFMSRLGLPDPGAQSAALMDLIYLHEELRPFLRPPAGDQGLRLEPAGPDDASAVLALIERHEGAESARWAQEWLTRQPQAWLVVRDGAQGVAGALATIRVDGVVSEDPAVVAALRALAQLPPLRDQERALLFRFWLSRDHYQGICPEQSLIAVQLGRTYLTTPGLAVTLLPFAEPEAWAVITAYADQHRMPEADFAVGGRAYGVYGHDWRVVTPTAWLALLALRETGASAPAPPTPVTSVLSKEEFAIAARQALRGVSRPDRLRGNPLLGSRLVSAQVAEGAPLRERVSALQGALTAACSALEGDRRAYRVLHRSFLAPAPSLEAAATALGLPSSTFRRHLRDAVDRVVELLWEQEVGS